MLGQVGGLLREPREPPAAKVPKALGRHRSTERLCVSGAVGPGQRGEDPIANKREVEAKRQIEVKPKAPTFDECAKQYIASTPGDRLDPDGRAPQGGSLQGCAQVMADLREAEGVGAKALMFTILTVSRTAGRSGPRVWIVPANRMKAGRSGGEGRANGQGLRSLAQQIFPLTCLACTCVSGGNGPYRQTSIGRVCRNVGSIKSISRIAWMLFWRSSPAVSWAGQIPRRWPDH